MRKKILAVLLATCGFASAAFVPGTLVTFRRRFTSCRLQAKPDFALLFDCDGVILETEELHRVAYNEAFKEFDLSINGEPVVWSVCRLVFCMLVLSKRLDLNIRLVQSSVSCLFFRRSNIMTSCRTQ